MFVRYYLVLRLLFETSPVIYSILQYLLFCYTINMSIRNLIKLFHEFLKDATNLIPFFKNVWSRSISGKNDKGKGNKAVKVI